MVRSLKGYQEMHTATAKSVGCYEAFMAARTLTAARRILFGVKQKKSGVCNCGQPTCIRYNGKMSHC